MSLFAIFLTSLVLALVIPPLRSPIFSLYRAIFKGILEILKKIMTAAFDLFGYLLKQLLIGIGALLKGVVSLILEILKGLFDILKHLLAKLFS